MLTARGTARTSIEVYDPQVGTWITGLTLKKQRTDHNCVAIDSSIYVMGRMERTSLDAILTSVEELSPSLLAPATQ